MTQLPQRAPTKTDVEMAKISGSVAVRHTIAQGISWSLRILSSGLPIYLLYRSIAALAGEETVFTISATIGISFAIITSPAVIALVLKSKKMRKQADELIRLRQRVIDLEERLGLTQTGKR